jgi:hypothetical protein
VGRSWAADDCGGTQEGPQREYRGAYQAVNAELVSLYWQLGEYISRKIAKAEWGDGVVEELASSLAWRFPGLRGFTRPNLFRMR